MQDLSDSSEIDRADVSDHSELPDSPPADDLPPVSDSDSATTTSTVLAEVLPGVAVVFGEVPAALKLDLVDFGLVPTGDRTQLATALASVVGNTATAGGNLANAISSAQGLYRVNSATQALLDNGAALAVKDGANLGAVFANGKVVAQARFIPVSVTAAQTVAAIGPALAMVALQMQLSQISGLVSTNLALTGQVLTTIRHEQWAELTGLVAATDRALDKAREIGSVPASLWDSVAGNEAALRKQLDLYRRNVGNHIKEIDRLGTQRRREYLDANAEAILFDVNALMSSLKAWTTHQALHAGKARVAGADDQDEARLVDIIARETRTEFDSALAETARLVDSLTRELRIVAELPGRATLPLTRKRRDSKAARLTSAELLKAMEPLADALRPPAPPLQLPKVVCAPKQLDLDPYMRVLRWFIEDEESLRCLSFPYQLGEGDVVKTVGQSVLGRLDPEKWATLVAVTDRRVITARASAFRHNGEISQDIPVDRVRYVRARTSPEGNVRSTIDLITRDADIRWAFHADSDSTQVDALAAVLAESMTIPDVEREQLIEGLHAQIEPGTKRDD
ncbi:hypothetical protein KZX45_13535 [Georgenia sp. EYE_87]|uniref:hypothetical protein n=1 Tax=Georgenia sp. EYE_87 TaxID=2853448 RepID=UPI002004871F|nr:hypothetical protein [Georgenia sp. EYE_87]MCK6211567.1 hypothetical protein [Georgenia sp. EYE_87]